MTHDELKMLVPAYSIGALPDDEAAELTLHLRGCDECTAELESFAGVSTAMAMSAPPEPLPAGFIDRVVAEATGEERRVGGRSRRWWSIAVASASAVAIVVMAFVVVTTRSNSDIQKDVLAVLSRDDGLALHGDRDLTGLARIVPSDDGSTFAATNLEPAPKGHVYELWVMRGTDCPSTDPASCEVRGVGTFEVEDRIALLDIDESISDWDIAAVTVEEKKVDFPTTDPVLISSS